jgi:NAD(P)-dependent dehydrogenase (short-subunit alcohol dehydrogenase family)
MIPDKLSQKVAVVTGSSSGIGREIALTLARNNINTYATMRDLKKGKSLEIIAKKEGLPMRFVQLDVTNDNSVERAIQIIHSEAGKIDILVNNAGYALTGPVEEISMEEIKKQYETNVFGLIRTIQAAIPIMRNQRSGIIINITSATGRSGYPMASVYASTNFAVEGLSESMVYELTPFGIKIVIVEPGIVKTNFLKSMVMTKKSQRLSSAYSPLVRGFKKNMEKMIQNGAVPEDVAKIVLKVINSKNPRLRYPVGYDSHRWMELRKSMSDEEFIRMIKEMGYFYTD